MLTLTYQQDKKVGGITRLTGWLSGNGFTGEGVLPNGTVIPWNATLTEKNTAVAAADTTKPGTKETGPIVYPFVGYGNETLPAKETVLIKNATIWTNEKEGILQNADVIVQNGKITKVGKGLAAPSGARTIDGTGKHLTSGIIDEHSHIALFSINEGGQSSSAEVRMSDAINPDDINIYRQLAGGVTASHLLHGLGELDRWAKCDDQTEMGDKPIGDADPGSEDHQICIGRKREAVELGRCAACALPADAHGCGTDLF